MAGKLVISTLNNDTGVLATQNGMTGICKAWVQFAGSSGTIAGSFNVSSITRSTTGRYVINMTTAMPNTNYSAVGTTSPSSGNFCFVLTDCSGGYGANARTTTAFDLAVIAFNAGGFEDGVRINVAVFSS
jgi:hypothetical protein